jgi:hypothetical protein
MFLQDSIPILTSIFESQYLPNIDNTHKPTNIYFFSFMQSSQWRHNWRALVVELAKTKDVGSYI